MSIYQRMEAQARGTTRRSGRLLLVIVEVVLVVTGFILVGLLLYMAQFSGGVRWFLTFGLLAVVAGVAWAYVSARTSEPAPLEPPTPKSAPVLGELSVFMTVVRRANEGLPYSQVLVSSRARDVFAERARLSLGLPPGEMRLVGADPRALRALVRDPVLEDLLHLPSTNPDERYRWVRSAREVGGFSQAIRRVLDRIEVWR